MYNAVVCPLTPSRPTGTRLLPRTRLPTRVVRGRQLHLLRRVREHAATAVRRRRWRQAARLRPRLPRRLRGGQRSAGRRVSRRRRQGGSAVTAGSRYVSVHTAAVAAGTSAYT